ncbi:MAG TPA: ABC transporter ATP-binding protein [Chloroflexota bacterium]|nr:ABC transporter ATP-binding protein [Chloroflexota bacterium]
MIYARALRREFGRSVAVDDVSLDVPEGTILALLGPNGAGKTTTVRMLAGLLAPTAGDAEVAGCDVRRQPADLRSRVGLVTDVPGLHDQMTPNSYLDFFGQLYGVPTSIRRSRIADLLAMFGLEDAATRRMAGFSRGMQHKVAIARALLHEPSVLFLDEPTAGLDPLAARMVRDLIVGLKHSSRTIVLCTHDLDEADRLADTVAIMRRGRVVACDAPGALRAAASRTTLVHVLLAHGDAALVERVRRLDGVLDPFFTASAAGGGLLTYRTVDAERVNPDVIAALVGEGARIVAVTRATASLEDAFALAVTGEPAA